MKIFIYLLALTVLLSSCEGPWSKGPVNLIPNPSVEEGSGSTVTGWNTETRSGGMIAFYDFIAHDGERSLMLHSTRPAGGRWMTRIALRPWSEYRFTGWVKTEDLHTVDGRGAGFRFDAFEADYPGLTGTNDWTKIEFIFSTGNDDSSVLSCLLNNEGVASGRAWFDDMSLVLLSSEKIRTSVTIDLSERGEPMSGYIYGQFIEHLGRCIYGGIWAEMLDDRKFWHTPGDMQSPWNVKGRKELFSVDRSAPFTGDKTPVLGADANGAASLHQSGLGLKPDLAYTGRIVLKATPGIRAVKVSLQWGETV